MLYINKNSDNFVTFTAKERMVDFNNSIYMELISETKTAVTTYTILNSENNLSLFRRYDRFVITEKASPNRTDSEIYLKLGTYVYNLYEWDPDTEDFLEDKVLLETGRLKVIKQEGITTSSVYD